MDDPVGLEAVAKRLECLGTYFLSSSLRRPTPETAASYDVNYETPFPEHSRPSGYPRGAGGAQSFDDHGSRSKDGRMCSVPFRARLAATLLRTG